jgi:hypothetical protein
LIHAKLTDVSKWLLDEGNFHAEKEMFEMKLKEVEHVVNPIMMSHSSPLTLLAGVVDDDDD